MRSHAEHACLLPATPVAPACGREFARAILAGRDGDPLDDVELVISELVTMAIRAGHGPVVLTITLGVEGVWVRVSIRDGAPVQGGLGWILVDRICGESGSQRDLRGLVWWGRLATSPRSLT